MLLSKVSSSLWNTIHYLLLQLSASLSSMELKAYGKAGVVAEEVLSAIRVVVSYNGQEREKQRSVPYCYLASRERHTDLLAY